MSNETSWSSASGDNNISNGSVSHIIDIRRRDGAEYLAQEIKNSLKTPESPQAPRRMPSLLLWNQEGLRLFEKITYLEEYYLTQAEIGILERMCKEIALKIKPNSLLVELGSG